MDNLIGFMNSEFYAAIQYISIILNFVLIAVLIVFLIVGIRFFLH